MGVQRAPVTQSHNLESRHVRHEANYTLWNAVNGLDDKHRLPIILRYANDLTIREIADILRIPEGTVHSRLHNGCKKLAASLAHLDVESLVLELFND